MPLRVLIERDKIRVSKPGFDANTNVVEELALADNMNVMPVYVAGSCFLSGKDARFYVGFPKPITNMPYVILTSNDGVGQGRYTYGFQISQDNGVYRGGQIRNFDGRDRNIWFSILRGF